MQTHNVYNTSNATAYNIIVELHNAAHPHGVEEKTVVVYSECNLNNSCKDIFASDIESCLFQQHNISDDILLHWEFADFDLEL